MKSESRKTIYLADYQPFSHDLQKVDMVFRLDPENTTVETRIAMRPAKTSVSSADLFLDGQDLTLHALWIDGVEVDRAKLTINDRQLIVPGALLPSTRFELKTLVSISPASNTALEGLYMSGGMYCTQCEAEGFRRITYYPDRPDVLSTFHVRVEGNFPVLLSNGNPVGAGIGWAEWHDPWPKPAYLFALVAGDLVAHSDEFVTASGRTVALDIFVREPDLGKCAYAMDALKRSMKWDEQVYGREYDLDVFNIVAVDDFNAGAMENKGLNIFNSKLVLASPETATDTDYEHIESVIAHEYFHNWTGNRITCRDWFQLSLKEGLTVFRDQQFSGDQRDHAIKRIEDVLDLRAFQFREDGGPLAHPVRPESFVEINNFYTATVYEKGAEVIRMLKTLVGDDAYTKALDLYFERHDGQATTIEAWLQVFEDTTGRDLSQFKRWYSQAGTPHVTVSDSYENGTYSLTFKQETPPTPGQPDKQPQVIPIAVGLLNPNGDEVQPTTILEMTEGEQTFTFNGLASKPVPSILRGFSAPVVLTRKTDPAERAFLLAHDTDPFNKWEAGRGLARTVLADMITEGKPVAPAYLDAIANVLADETLDPSFRALALALPSEDNMAQALNEAGLTPDPAKIHSRREDLRYAMAKHLESTLSHTYDALTQNGPFSPDAGSAAQRALRNTALSLLTLIDGGDRASAQFHAAHNMTDELAAFASLIPTGFGAEAVDTFYYRWHHDRLVMDKWFALQPGMAEPDKALKIARALENHKDFNWHNPNRLRSLLNGLVRSNPAAFHASDGAAYDWLADWVIRVDAENAQVAARATVPFDSWRRYDADRQDLIQTALKKILAQSGLSSDTREMVSRILGTASEG
ncbi:MAG: aminopeptidase N [Paracoccaceae bacterium]|nr:aminopeptidase N [Paracoccaceae bacterium]